MNESNNLTARRQFIKTVLKSVAAVGLSNEILNQLQYHGFASAFAATNAAKSPTSQKPNASNWKKGLPIIAIDAGHGGHDPGAIGYFGTLEKEVTINVARELSMQLQSSGRFRTLLTRSGDDYIKLPNRVRLARRGGADLFISLHADATDDLDLQGFSVYTLSEKASDSLAKSLADNENAVDRLLPKTVRRESKEIREILMDMIKHDTQQRSMTIAKTVTAVFPPLIKPISNPIRQANFMVLKAPEIPSVLIEMGFMSNPKNEMELSKNAYRNHISTRLAKSVHRYFDAVS